MPRRQHLFSRFRADVSTSARVCFHIVKALAHMHQVHKDDQRRAPSLCRAHNACEELIATARRHHLLVWNMSIRLDDYCRATLRQRQQLQVHRSRVCCCTQHSCRMFLIPMPGSALVPRLYVVKTRNGYHNETHCLRKGHPCSSSSFHLCVTYASDGNGSVRGGRLESRRHSITDRL